MVVVDKVRLGWRMLMLVLYSSSGGQGKVGMVDAYVGGIVTVVDKVRLGWWMLMLVLYSSSGGHGKVGMEDAYVGAE